MNVTVNGTRPAPPSPGEVAGILSERIRNGVMKAGGRMPTQESLSDEFGVERGVIRQALRLLEDAGLLTGRTRGAPARIAELPPGRTEAAGEPQQTAAALGPRIMEAFGAPHVSIDAVCLTAESLNLAVAEPLQLIRSGKVTPETVKVRLMVPSRDLKLAFPRPAEEKSDDGPRVHEQWLTNRNNQGTFLRHNLRVLRSTRSIDVEVTLKALPFTPTTKLYLLNGSEALFAYYTVKRREEQFDDTPIEIYDALGMDSMLFRFERGGGKRDEAFVTQSQAWFDGLWGTIATEITLDN